MLIKEEIELLEEIIDIRANSLMAETTISMNDVWPLFLISFKIAYTNL